MYACNQIKWLSSLSSLYILIYRRERERESHVFMSFFNSFEFEIKIEANETDKQKFNL